MSRYISKVLIFPAFALLFIEGCVSPKYESCKRSREYLSSQAAACAATLGRARDILLEFRREVSEVSPSVEEKVGCYGRR